MPCTERERHLAYNYQVTRAVCLYNIHIIIIHSSPTGYFRQTIYHPLALFAQNMRDGTAIRVSVKSPTFGGETLPSWIGPIKGAPFDLDASAVLVGRSLRLAVVNRSETKTYDVPLRIAFEKVKGEVTVHELWHQDVTARNGWGKEEEVSVKTRKADWTGRWAFREHSFTLFVFDLE